MKKLFFWAFIALTSCEGTFNEPFYHPQLPELPQLWEENLGKAHWRLEWIAEGFDWQEWEGESGSVPSISLGTEWTVPVLAWPYWPEKGIEIGAMRPAGALFPWDASGANIFLSWEHGVDAFLWRELAEKFSGAQASGTPRFPWYFDWPRFRELMKSDDVPAEVRIDPWLPDWPYIAERTVESGFDRRRIRAEAKTGISVSCPAALWFGSSPFAAPIETFGVTAQFPSGEKTENWFSSLGRIKIQKEAWVFIPWEGK